MVLTSTQGRQNYNFEFRTTGVLKLLRLILYYIVLLYINNSIIILHIVSYSFILIGPTIPIL